MASADLIRRALDLICQRATMTASGFMDVMSACRESNVLDMITSGARTRRHRRQ
jgi:hypothetical protein